MNCSRVPLRIFLLVPLISLAVSAQKPELIVQTGHSKAVNSVAFSPDGTILATVSNDMTVKLWDVYAGKELRTLRGHTLFTNSVAFSPDGRTLASGSSDKTAKLWDVTTGQELRTLLGYKSDVRSVAFSPDGAVLATATSSIVRLWNTSTWETLRTLTSRYGPVNNIAFSPDGRLLAGGCGESLNTDYAIELWEVSTGKELHPLTGHSLQINHVCFSPDGKTLASGSSDKTVKLWEVSTGRELRTFAAKFDYVVDLGADVNNFSGVNSVDFSNDGRVLASGNYDGKIKLWDVASGKEINTFEGVPDWVSAVAFSPRDMILAGSSYGKTIKLWNALTGEELWSLSGTSGFVNSIAFSPDHKRLVTGTDKLVTIADYDATVKVWDLFAGGGLRSLKGHIFANSVTFSPDGKLLASGGAEDYPDLGNKTIRLWDVQSWKELRVLGGDLYTPDQRLALSRDGRFLIGKRFQGDIKVWDTSTGKEVMTFKGSSDATFSPDGKLVANGGNLADDVIRLWDTSTWQEVRPLKGHMFLVTEIVFSPDGRLLANGNYDGTATLWNVSSGEVIRSLRGDSRAVDPNKKSDDAVTSVAFSPDGKVLAGGRMYGETISLWDLSTGRELHLLKGHSRFHFSPNSKLLATTGDIYDYTIKLWDVSTGKELHTLKGHSDQIKAIGFAPDGKILVSGGTDATVKLWDVETGGELASLLAIDENDWAVVTPEGLFDGSPSAWKKLIWRLDNNTFKFVPVEAFFKEFYYPGLLAEIMAGKRPKPPAKNLAEVDVRQPGVNITRLNGQAVAEDPRRQPLTLANAVSKRSTEIEIQITDNGNTPSRSNQPATSGARDLRLFRNGSLVKVWRGDVLKGQGSVTLEATVPIVAGENKFTAYAFNHDNIKSSDAELVVTGADSLKRQGTAYVLAIGVNSYANQNYNLKYAVADAEDFAAEIKRQQESLKRYAKVEIIALSDAQATKANITQRLAELAKQVQPEDAVIVFFAGHGTAQGNQFYLIPHDLGYDGPRENLNEAGLQTILAHSISDRELEKLFELIDAGQLLFVIDACNSGQALEAEEKRRGPMNSKGLAQLAYEKGMYVLTAAQSYQAAREAGKFGHGFLTYALVEEGLKQGAADREPKNGSIDIREWLNFATDEVPKMQEQNSADALRGRGRYVVFVGDGRDVGIPKSEQGTRDNVQRPRVFYRREQETNPLVIANVGSKP